MQSHQVQIPSVGSGTRKRGLKVSVDHEQVNADGKRKKSKIVSGVISNNDPISVEVVEQPRRSQ
jgi:hypothetical protein